MDKVARFSAAQRRELFSEAAARLGMTPAVVEADYRAMADMIFGRIPDFAEIVAELRALEKEVNASRHA